MYKYYIGNNSADGDSYFIVKLSDEEYKAVCKFVDAQSDTFYEEDYSGSFGISLRGFDTRDEAISYARSKM